MMATLHSLVELGRMLFEFVGPLVAAAVVPLLGLYLSCSTFGVFRTLCVMLAICSAFPIAAFVSVFRDRVLRDIVDSSTDADEKNGGGNLVNDQANPMPTGMWCQSKDVPAGQMDPYKPGTVVQMAFRRKKFVYTEKHLCGWDVMNWVDIADTSADLIYASYSYGRQEDGCQDHARVGGNLREANPQDPQYRPSFGYTRNVDGYVSIAEEGSASVHLDKQHPRMMPSEEFISIVGSHCATPMPSWIDWNALEDGCQFYTQTWPMVSYTFGWAVIGGFGNEAASAVLLKSRYWASKGEAGRIDTWKRLRETLCFLYDISCHGAASFKPGGEAWKACLLVRWLHCRARTNVWQKCTPVTNETFYSLPHEEKEKAWNVERYGEPINQGELLGSLLGSSALILEGMEELAFNVPFSSRQREGFIHLWRVVGFLFGIEDRFNQNTSYENAKIAMESVLLFGIPANPIPEITASLTNHILDSVTSGINYEIAKKVKGLAGIKSTVVAMPAWLFLGREHGKAIGLPEVSNWSTLLAGYSRRYALGVVLLLIVKVPGAAGIAQRILGFMFKAAVKQIRADQSKCRFGAVSSCTLDGAMGDTCPVTGQKRD